MGVNLEVEIGKLKLKNPIILASGCAGYGIEMEDFFPLNEVGAIVLKGISLKESIGNPPPRIWETPSGLINSIGLQNVGLKRFLEEKVPHLKGKNAIFIANFYGKTLEEYVDVAIELDKVDILQALEMNISCPNVKEGGIQFGLNPETVYKVVGKVKDRIKKPLWVKLTPSTNIREIAKAAVDANADVLVAINSVPSMAIDIENFEYRVKNRVGGLSGPAIHPIALKLANDVVESVKVPVIGCGGISSYKDALEFILIGCRAFELGTALFYNPLIPLEIKKDIEDYLRRKGFSSISEVIGLIKKGGNYGTSNDCS